MSETGREQRSSEEILEAKILDRFENDLRLGVGDDATEEEKKNEEAKEKRDELIKEKVRQKLYFEVVNVPGAPPESAFDQIQRDIEDYKDYHGSRSLEEVKRISESLEEMAAHMEKFRPAPEADPAPVPAPENPVVENPTLAVEKPTTPAVEIKATPEILSTRKNSTEKLLTALKTNREKLPGNNPVQIQRKESVKEIDSALVALSDPINNIEPALKFINGAVLDRAEVLEREKDDTETRFLNDDRVIVRLIDESIALAIAEKAKGVDILSDSEIAVFGKFLKAADSDKAGVATRPLIQELSAKLQELKEGKVQSLPAEQKPAPAPDNPTVANPDANPATPPAPETAPAPAPVAEPAELELAPEQDLDEARRENVLRKIEERLVERYVKLGSLPKKTKELLDKEVGSEVEDVHRIFVLKWIQEKEGYRSGYFKDRGVSLENMDDAAKAKIILGDARLRKEALTDLDEKEEFKEYRDERNRGIDLMADLGKENIPIETQYLLVNFSQKLLEKKQLQLEALQHEGAGQDLIDAKSKEIEALFGAQKDLAEKITGKSLEKMAEDELAAGGDKKMTATKDEFVASVLEAGKKTFEDVSNYPKDELDKKYDEAINKSTLSDAQKKELQRSGSIAVGGWFTKVTLSRREAAMAAEMGIDISKIKRKGFFGFSKEIVAGERVLASDLNDLNKQTETAWNKTLSDIVKAEATKKAEASYADVTTAYEAKKKEIIEREIANMAQGSAKAEGGVLAIYEKIKRRLAAEFLEQVVKKERKEDQIKKLSKLFSAKKRADFGGFIQDALNRFERFEGVDFTHNDHMKLLSDFLGEHSVKVSAKKLEGCITEEQYKKAIGGKKSFVDFVLSLVSDQPWVTKKI